MLVNDTAQKSSCFESLSFSQQAELITFVTGLIQGALTYKDSFTVPDIVGGKFSHWSNTPLDYIYQYHEKKRFNSEEAQAEAGKDVGRIVKYIMSIDKHRFYKIIDPEQRRYPVNVYALVKIDSE